MFLIMALLILGIGNSVVAGFSVYYRMFDGILSFYPLDASSTPNKEKYSQTLPCDAREQSTPSRLPQPARDIYSPPLKDREI